MGAELPEVITFHSEDTDFYIQQEDAYRNWLTAIAVDESAEIINLAYIFCSDEYLRGINKEYLQHDYYTDIITFPYKQGSEVESDIFISIDRVQDNAKQHNVDQHQELLRVMSHGLLHLCGYGDKTEQEIKTMRLKEDASIALWPVSARS